VESEQQIPRASCKSITEYNINTQPGLKYLTILTVLIIFTGYSSGIVNQLIKREHT